VSAHLPAGDWDIGFRQFSIADETGGLTVRFPEAPDGFEGRLRQIEPDRFVIEGGPYPGAELVLGADGWSIGGVLPLTRIEGRAAAPPGSGLIAPGLDLEAVEVEACEAAWARLAHPSHVADLDLRGVAIHRFIQWLMLEERVIFHGSNNRDLTELTPIRRSMEIMNLGGRGNLGSVYGTHDGLWSMFFAVVDRSRLRGSIRNGVDRHFAPSDEWIDLYHFSVHHEMLGLRPFTTGALYLMPREQFERVPLYPGGPPSNEWACPHTVASLARLLVRPEDFPFLDEIGGHDDGPLIDFEVVTESVYEGVVSAQLVDQGIEIVTTTDPATVARFVGLSEQFFPDVKRSIVHHTSSTSITMTGPEAFQHGIRRRFADLITPD
jgi:hypothetical protein